MNKKQYTFLALFACLLVAFGVSCGDDDNTYDVSKEWMDQQRDVYDDAANRYAEEGGKELFSQSGDGSVHWIATDSLKTVSSRISKEGHPYITDTVVCRYKGWYFDENGKRIVFDTTEKGNNNFVEAQFDVNGVILGWTDILMNMKEGDEREIVLPHQLAYGINGQVNQTTGARTIPGYTTLFFTIKLVKIKPMNPNEWD